MQRSRPFFCLSLVTRDPVPNVCRKRRSACRPWFRHPMRPASRSRKLRSRRIDGISSNGYVVRIPVCPGSARCADIADEVTPKPSDMIVVIASSTILRRQSDFVSGIDLKRRIAEGIIRIPDLNKLEVVIAIRALPTARTPEASHRRWVRSRQTRSGWSVFHRKHALILSGECCCAYVQHRISRPVRSE